MSVCGLGEEISSWKARALEAEKRQAAAEEEVLRGRADAENLKKLYERRQKEDKELALEEFCRALLPVADSLRRAKFGMSGEEPWQSVMEGLSLTGKLLDSAFAGVHLRAIEPQTGDSFCPREHNAMAELSCDLTPGTVHETMRLGFRLGSFVLRPAEVVVARSDTSEVAGSDTSEMAGSDTSEMQS